MIKTRILEDGMWQAWTEESPFMKVEGDTEEIAYGIIERGLFWYHARQSERIQQMMMKELAEIVMISDKVTIADDVARLNDTAPSEITITDHQDEYGC
jgi:hypothetical protein